MKLPTHTQLRPTWSWLTGISVTTLMLLLYCYQPTQFQRLEGWAYDLALRTAHQPLTGQQVAVVAIDDASLRTLGRWPWPRDVLARLLATIAQAQPAAVALDLLLAEGGPCAAQCAPYVGAATTQDHDAQLAQTLQAGPFVLSYNFTFAEALPFCALPPSKLAWRGQALNTTLIAAHYAVCPLPSFAKAAPQSGFLNAVADADGLYRRIPLLMAYQDGVYPALALAAVQRAQGNPVLLLESDAQRLTGVRIGKQFVPTDGQAQVLLHYRAPHATPQYSAVALLDNPQTAEILRGKVVFVGITASGLNDSHATPVASVTSGVLIHATLADNLLAMDVWHIPTWAGGLIGLVSLATGLSITGLAIRLGQYAGWVLGSSLGLLLALGSTSVGLLALQGIWVSPLWPVLTGSLCLLSLLWLSFWHSDRQRRLIHGTFARYVAPNILATLTRSQHLPTLQGEDHEITVLFADIHGFGTLAEQLSAHQLSALLNRYFTPMTWIILAHQGTFDKYIGDTLMAFWNAPTSIPQHPLQAVRAATAMLDALLPLNREFQRDYGQSLRISIALHTGTAQVGNMGSLDLFDYTALGANVNLAAKMLRLSRDYDVPLLISETVVPAVEDAYYCLTIDQLRVRGLQRVVTLYTPIPHAQVVERHFEFRTYERALQLYKAGQFSQALKTYSDLAQRYPAQRLYALYAQRCTHLTAHPPEHWDGVWDAQAQN